ncbi:unnamed protein product [Fasciola hepatica]|uniref:SCP domain-containing protein n=1 Tax=Fasciola hepatica TaxID=6192 RepID=A0ABC9HFM6_FASHE
MKVLVFGLLCHLLTLLAMNATKEEMNQIMVNLHNEFRRKVLNGQLEGQPKAKTMPDLVYDSELANKAQDWANECKIRMDEFESRYTRKYQPFGQNLISTFSFERAFEVWTDESVNYIYFLNTCEEDTECDAYTQVVWAKSEAIGCGYQNCENITDVPWTTIIICNYGPTGNLEREHHAQSEDVLICGICHRLFDQVDELISHKMAGCSLGKTTGEACRCRAGTANQASVECTLGEDSADASTAKDDTISNAEGDSQQSGTGSGVSDWEADDEYDDVPEVTEVSESFSRHEDNDPNQKDARIQVEADVEATGKSPEPGTHTSEVEPITYEPHFGNTDAVSPSLLSTTTVLSAGQHNEHIAKQGTDFKKPEPPLHHRSHRGEYGRHETIADDDNDESDEETGAESKLARST